jgi:SAM-dependent methyltransferase
MKKNKKKFLHLKKIKKCPICKSKHLFVISNIKSKIKEIDSKFDLIKCIDCSHRTISKIPNEKLLKNLYKDDSPLVFGGAHSELKVKKNFIAGNFEKVEPYQSHWIFNYLDKKNGNYFELGPGMCSLYKTFFEKGWKCQGLELRSFIKAPGLKNDFKKIDNKQDVAVAFDVLEHVIDPIKYLKIIKKKIKRGGKIFLTFPNSDSFKSRILKDKWAMVSPLAHIHYFSNQSTKIMLRESGFKIILIKDFSFVIPIRLIRNILKLPLFFIKDLINLEFKNIIFRLVEIFLNILDLIKGDQLKVVAKKI